MEHPFLVAGIVLIGFIALGYSHSQSYKGYGYGDNSQYLCYMNAAQGDECGENRRCSWNRRECPGYPDCHLICTDNPYKWCYGLNNGDSCTEDGDVECWPDVTGMPVCIDVENLDCLN